MPSRRLLAATTLAALLLPTPLLAAELTTSERTVICGARVECNLIAVTDAGHDDGGASLRVAEIVLGAGNLDDSDPADGCRSTEAALAGGENDAGREFWLLAGDASPQQVLSLCNDGYGASGVGEDWVEIGANRLVHQQYGGSAWRWSVSKTIRLSPLMVVEEANCSYHNVAPGTAELAAVDRTTFAARAYTWVTEDVAEDDLPVGCPEIMTDFARPLEPSPAPGVLAAHAVPFPFAADASPLPTGTTLGSCALALTSDGANGFLIHGEAAAEAEAAEMRVIAETGNALLIQIRDPLAGGNAAAKSWVGEAHVEIWTARANETVQGDPALPATLYDQIGIGLAGEVHIGAGAPPALPRVEAWPGQDELGRDVTVLRVTWDDEFALLDGLGVVYSQAEGGKQKRLVANAAIRRNKPLFLPSLWHNYPEELGIPNGMCRFSGESLQLDL